MGCGGSAPERFESIELLDAQLVSMTRREAGARLRLGQVLEVMRRKACCFELGFSSLAAYALERCERAGRWVEVACCLARRLEALPLLRAALAVAQRKTLREMRQEMREVSEVALTDGREATCTLTGTVDREEAWLFEATRALLDHFGTRGAEEQLEALLAEGQGALLAALPAEAMDLQALDAE